MIKDNKNNIKNITKELLKEIGENPNREGLLNTPDRVSRLWEYLSKGYRQDVKELINGAIFNEKYDQMVAVKDIEFYSMCEHHLLPFFGKIQIVYSPDGRVFGISKLVRLVEKFSRRLQIQERLTKNIADELYAEGVKGVAVLTEAEHLCMKMRGVRNNANVTSAAFRGIYERKEEKERIVELIKNPKKSSFL